MAEGPRELHCAEPVGSVGALRACRVCLRVFRSEDGGLVELVGPSGFRVKASRRADAPEPGYRAPAAERPQLVLVRSWALPVLPERFTLRRTTVLVDAAEVVRMDELWRWRRPVRIRRGGSLEVMESPRWSSVGWADPVRRGAGGSNAPTIYDVRLAAEGAPPLVLFERVGHAVRAREVRNLVAELLAATHG